ncbi:unnamed protein product [Hymenolepis diminuta]|uniref:Uncharacterized protein n=1 Tax=Hymenolepis diminuta TaxID=6216 RepID=A0A564YAN2_HYMDI|nr:unnamed protein product [Hymenolepis diminuta]
MSCLFSTKNFFAKTGFFDHSNRVQENIHDFLSKQAVVTRKSQDKRKRKRPELTASNQPNCSDQPSNTKPKHYHLLFKIKRRQQYLIHTNPLLAIKPYNFNPTTTISINLPTSSQTPSQSTKLRTVKHKMQLSSSPTLSRKFSTWNLLAVIDKSNSSMERTPKEETTDV